MSDRALVAIDTTILGGAREEVIQREILHGLVTEFRRTPALYGIGFLEAVEKTSDNGEFRIGAHSRRIPLRDFVSSAFATELGVSTTLHCARKRVDAPYPVTCQSRLENADLDDVVSYLRYLAPPAPPSRPSDAAENIFKSTGCAACHLTTLSTRTNVGSYFSSYSIRPYTDLEAHNIGTSVKGPVRTAPLWGLNSFGPPFLHNGKANSIEEAIASHKADSENSRMAFDKLTSSDKEILLSYLRSF